MNGSPRETRLRIPRNLQSHSAHLPGKRRYERSRSPAVPRTVVNYRGGGWCHESGNHRHTAHHGESRSASLDLSSGSKRCGVAALFMARKNLSRSVSCCQRR